MIEPFLAAIREHVDLASVRTILDLGSRDGLQAAEFASAFPNAQVFAFEANPHSISACLRNTAQFPSIEVVPLAVLDRAGRIPFYPTDTRYNQNVGASSVYRVNRAYYDQWEVIIQTEIEVEAVRLDHWAAKRGITAFDLVWSDLQAADLHALRGMGAMLSTVKALAVEVNHVPHYIGQPDASEITSFIEAAGLRYVATIDQSVRAADIVYCR